MPKIDWTTLIATDGKVSLFRLRKFVSIVLGVIGGLAIAVGMLIGMFTQINTQPMIVGGGFLVAPITGGQIGDALHGKLHSDKVLAGAAPGRRSSDREQGDDELEVDQQPD